MAYFTTEQLLPHIKAWLDMIAENAASYPQPILGLGKTRVRDNEGRCPLCALAAASGCQRFNQAWKLALREAFGELGTIDDSACAIIAAAADWHEHWLRWDLLQAMLGQVRTIDQLRQAAVREGGGRA